MIKHTCKRCGVEFERPKNNNEYKFCSNMCANQRMVEYDVDRLREYALKGLTLQQIGRLINRSYTTVRMAIARHGLYRDWQNARYKKCREAA